MFSKERYKPGVARLFCSRAKFEYHFSSGPHLSKSVTISAKAENFKVFLTLIEKK